MNLPALTYQQALLAALSGDAQKAERDLGAALDQGWLDAGALDRDIGWRRYANAPWFAAARARLRERAAAQREQVAALRMP